MHQTCRQCSAGFMITDEDLAFYDKISPLFNGKKELLPPPTLCPDCRMQKRMLYRNEMHVFLSASALSGARMMSQYSPISPRVVYSQEEWASDVWDSQTYGITPDASGAFFPQFNAQLRRIPVPSRSVIGNENCEYVTATSWCKNCYMVGASTKNEDCSYCYNLGQSKDCMDCNFIFTCERCYECVNCRGCSRVRYSRKCIDCHDGAFLLNCRNCSHCFGCANLVRKEYCFFNEQLTREEYEKRVSDFNGKSRKAVEEMYRRAEEHWLRFSQKYMLGEMNDCVTGSNIFESRNAQACFDASKLEDCAYCWTFHEGKDCMDCFGWGRTGELCYECTEVGDGVTNIIFSAQIYNSHDVLYSVCCQNSHHLFGCVAMKNASYCIFNTQYSPEEYEQTVPLLIEVMRAHGEWGEFFPISLAPFAYNACGAIDYFPLKKSDAETLGAAWYEEQVSSVSGLPETPDTMDKIGAASTVFRCAARGVPFKMIEQEISFYKEEGLPPPKYCFAERTKNRFAQSERRTLYHRACDKCGKDMETTYAPDRPEIVYCEQCYLEAVY